MTSPSLHDVLPALEPHLAALLRALLALARDVVGERDHLGADEALLEIGVDHARRLRRRRAGVNRPRAHFLRPGREVGLRPSSL